MSNITTRTELVYPNAVICEVQPVRVEEFKGKSSIITDVFSKINIDKSDITPEEFRKANEFISKYKDVFSTGDADVGYATDVTHKIELSDEHPFAQRYRKIPPAMINEVREHINLLLKTGIIRKSFPHGHQT